jgi:hypothetical protein
MRRILCLLAVFAGFTLTAAHAGDAGTFFNGKDLTGFEGLIDQYWSVKDGAIVGTGGDKKIPFNTFLCSKNKYKDFELSFQVRLKGGKGNSGVQIRSKIFDMKKYAVSGPQCDMGDIYWGSLYGEQFGGMMKQADAKLVKEVLKADDFNDYSIKCVGKHVTIKLNGKTTVDADFPKMPDEGIIAFQIHGGHVMEVTFRKIQFKEIK